jgi:branched-chain amino acid transport system substrate-binding protein
MNKRKSIFIGIVAVVILLVTIMGRGSGFSDESPIQARENLSNEDREYISIGLPIPVEIESELTYFMDGADMAIKEINDNGGLLGMELRYEVKDDQVDIIKSMKVADELVNDPHVVGVVGHWTSDCTLPTADIYERAGIVLISPIATADKLTSTGKEYVFRNTVSDTEMAENLAKYCEFMSYRNVAIIYEDREAMIALSADFERLSNENNINIIDRHASFVSKEAYKLYYDKWKTQGIHAILLVGNVDISIPKIEMIREIDSELPIVSTDGLNYDLVSMIGKKANNIACASLFYNSKENKEYMAFREKFFSLYGVEPDFLAVCAYDSIKLLAHAIEEAGSTSPKKVIEALNKIENLPTVRGPLTFDEKGQAIDLIMGIKNIVDEKYEYLFLD